MKSFSKKSIALLLCLLSFSIFAKAEVPSNYIEKTFDQYVNEHLDLKNGKFIAQDKHTFFTYV